MKANLTLAQMPFVRILLPFIGGIYLAYLFKDFLVIFLSAATFLVAAVFFSFRFYFAGNKFFSHFHIHFLLIALFFLLGGLLVHVELLNRSVFQFRNDEIKYVAMVDAQPVQKEKGVSAELKLLALSDTISPQKSLKMMAFIDSAHVQNLKYGDVLFIQSQIHLLKSNSNPGQFDYAEYLARKHIYHQTRIADGYYFKMDSAKGNFIIRFSQNLQQKLIDIYAEAGISGDEFAVLSALTLGYKSNIDEDTVLAFGATGTTHVLAVSGIHVGLIYLILMFFMQWIKETSPKVRFFKFLVIVINLWLFALISGMSPSVLRAALMFSLFTAGSFYNRKLNMYNIMAGSALILLLNNPFLLFDIGFQLSYLAVFSIVALQKPIENLFEPGNKVLRHIWSLTSVTLAAQLGTTPLTLYYFHQFPVYFLFSNLVLVPVSSLVLYSAVVLIAISFSSWLAALIAKLVVWQVQFMTFTAKWIATWPMATWADVYISRIDMAFMYTIIVFIIIWLQSKKYNHLIRILYIVVLFAGIKLIFQLYTIQKPALWVHNTNKGITVSLVEHNKLLNINDSVGFSHFENTEKFISQFTAENELLKLHPLVIDSLMPNIHPEKPKWPVYTIHNKKIAIITGQDWLEYKTQERLRVDVLIVASNLVTDINSLFQLFEPQKVVLGANLFSGKIQRFASVCRNLKIDYHNIKNEGPFCLPLN